MSLHVTLPCLHRETGCNEVDSLLFDSVSIIPVGKSKRFDEKSFFSLVIFETNVYKLGPFRR